MKFLLIIDVGTQSLRVAILDKKGRIIGKIKKEYECVYDVQHDQIKAEQDADFYFYNIINTIRELNNQYHSAFNNIMGVVMDTFRDSAVLLDENYKPLHKCILWLDGRTATVDNTIKKRPFIHRLIFKLLGVFNIVKSNMERSMSIWYQNNLPNLWSQARHYGNISSYLNYKLTDEFNDVPSNMVGHYPLNFKKETYYKDNSLRNIFNIPLKMLPKLIQSGCVLGKISQNIAKLTGLKVGLPLYGGSDKSCELLGTGAIRNNTVNISFSSCSTINMFTRKYFIPEKFMPSYPSCISHFYNVEKQVYRSYDLFPWFLRLFYHEKTVKISNDLIQSFNKNMLQIPAGSNDLMIMPYWQPCLTKPQLKGIINGLTFQHTDVHIYRAIIEGMLFVFRKNLEYFEKKNHHKVNCILISGGGSQSDEICQITSDVFGIQVVRVQTFETSLLGAAILGFLSIGEFKSLEEAVKEMIHRSSVFMPNKENHNIYEKLFYKYKKIFPTF